MDLIKNDYLGCQFKPGIRVTHDQYKKIILRIHEIDYPLADYSEHIFKNLVKLQRVENLAKLRDRILCKVNAIQASIFLCIITKLIQLNTFNFLVLHKKKILLTIVPQTQSFIFNLHQVESHNELALSRFALIRRNQDKLMIESPLAKAYIILESPICTKLLFSLQEPCTINQITRDLADTAKQAHIKILTVLAACNFLALANTSGLVEENAEPLLQWEFHDLLFHARWRMGRHANITGGVYPYLDKLPPLPAVKATWPGMAIALPKADVQSLIAKDIPFTAILEQRQSIREYDEENPITKEQLGAFLYRAARVKREFSNNVSFNKTNHVAMEFTSRPYPTGGASYELEIYVTINRCKGLSPGLYHYNPLAHTLTKILDYSQEVHELIKDASLATAYQANPQVLLTIAARFQRVSWKYRSIAYAVMLRNTGVLYQTFYLVAIAMGLAPCGIGNGNSERFSKLTGLNYFTEGSLGEFILGSRKNVNKQ
jgi:SagB-type dehydrogenase family enzyme